MVSLTLPPTLAAVMEGRVKKYTSNENGVYRVEFTTVTCLEKVSANLACSVLAGVSAVKLARSSLVAS